MVRHLRGAFERSAVLQISRNARRPERMIADLRYLVAWRLCEACLDVEAASIMLFE
jgi:hypothetical protein